MRAWFGEEAGVARTAARVDALLLPVLQQLIKKQSYVFLFNSVGLVSSALDGYFGSVMPSEKRHCSLGLSGHRKKIVVRPPSPLVVGPLVEEHFLRLP